MRIEENVALIESRLLHAAIWGDTRCIFEKNQRFTGYVYSDIDHLGKAFIEYCISRILGIFRLPGCGYDNYLNCSLCFSTLDENEVIEACEELKHVMEHVQGSLIREEIARDDKVSVVRCLSGYQVGMAASQLQDPELQEISFPVSILSSYAHDGDFNTNYASGEKADPCRHINIREKIPVDRIILWDRFVGDGINDCNFRKSMADSEHELWVVDTSINGIKKLPRSSFYYPHGLPATQWYKSFDFGTNRDLYYRSKRKRPCEYEDILTRFCMKRNLKKSEKDVAIIGF